MKPHIIELRFRRLPHSVQLLLKLSLFSSFALILLLLLIPLYDHTLLHEYPYTIPLPTPLSNSSQTLGCNISTVYTLSSPPPPPPPSPSPSTPPPPPPPPPRPPSLNTDQYSKRVESIKDCDISKGEWVWDPKGHYYTNTSCWTIQEHQNCMKYGRPDVDFLKWRWRPDGCDLPRFDPDRFLELVRDKSMAFVGDSLARNQMQSLMCLLSRVAYPKDISHTSDENFKRMHYATHNFTISIFWSPFLIKAHENHSVWHLHLDKVDTKWSSQLHNHHYLIISTGNWFTRPSIYYKSGKLIGCQYCMPAADDIPYMALHTPHRLAFRTALRAIVRHRGYTGTTFLRTVSPAHFENGTWDKGGDCVRTRPFGRGEARMKGEDRRLYRAQVEEFERAKKAAGMKKGRRFAVVDTTAAMVMRPDGHPGRYGHRPQEKVAMYNDCVHWCLPGPIDTWNDFLMFEMMRFPWTHLPY